MLTRPTKFSVVVTVKNEEKRIKDCLATVFADNPDEVILVDGEPFDFWRVNRDRLVAKLSRR